MDRSIENINRSLSNSVWGLFLLVFLSCGVLLSYLFREAHIVLIVNILSSILFFIFIYVVYQIKTRYISFNLFIIINYCWFVLSLNFLEGGSYTPELELFGNYTGATVRFILICTLFIIFSILGSNLLSYKAKLKLFTTFQRNGLIFMYVLLQLVVISIYIYYGTALGNHIDRIEYRNNVAPVGYFQIITILTFLCYPLGWVRINIGKQKKYLDTVFIITLLLLVLGGEKFSFLILAICLYIFAHMKKIKINFKNFGRVLILVLIIGALIVKLAEVQYSKITEKGIDRDMSQLIFDRIAQQAQLNYYFDDYIFIKEHRAYGGDEFLVHELIKDNQHLQGVNLLMSIASPPNVYKAYAETGVTFGDGFPAILYVYFSWGAFLISGILGFIYGVLSTLCMKFLYEGRLIETMILMYLIYNTTMSIFLNGEFYLISDISITKFIAIGILFVLSLVRLSKYSRF